MTGAIEENYIPSVSASEKTAEAIKIANPEIIQHWAQINKHITENCKDDQRETHRKTRIIPGVTEML